MSVAATPSYSSMHRASAIVLGVGFALSVAVHLGVGAGASGYLGSVWGGDDSSEKPIEIEPESGQLIAPPEEVRLGMQESAVASINWLGVIDNPEIGDAPVAQVEQAEFTRQVGDAPATVSPEPMVQEEQIEVVESEVVEVNPSEQIELEVEPDDSAPVVIEVQPEPVEVAEDEVVDEVVEEPVNEPVEAHPEERAQEVAPSTAGKDGIVSKKESTASILKRAIRVNAKRLNRPIVGKGLEITTVEPRFPATVRFTELPSNPVLMIRFNASGRVSKVYFLTEGKRVFDTGVRGVDEPLLSAVYQWRAKGKEIDALDPSLDPDDPDSYIEISMWILFRKEGKSP